MPHTLHTRSLAAHVIDLDAAFLYTGNEKPRKALALLEGDPIAQIMSFASFQEKRRGLSAVSPQMRHDREMMADGGYSNYLESISRVSVRPFVVSDALTDTVLFYRILAAKESDQQQMMLSLWWASRCGLPVELIVANHDSAVLACLNSTLRSRVKRMSVDMRSSAAGSADAATVSSSAPCVTALTSMLSFPSLQSLSVKNNERLVGSQVSVEAASTLTTAASLPVEVLELDGWRALHDLSTLTGSLHIRTLIVSNSGVQSLEGLCRCATLEKLSFSECPGITTVAALAGLSRLEAVEVRRCDLHSLDGLDRCVSLTTVDVSCNRNLHSLSALAGAPLLRDLNASMCDIRSVQGLGSCSALLAIVLHGNRNLHSLGDLSSAPCLESVAARRCDLLDLGAAGPWSALRRIDVCENSNLQSVSGLSVAPLLQTISVLMCDIRNLRGLGSCASLSDIMLFRNRNLHSLGDLSKAPSLRKVSASQCDLLDLGDAGMWSALREIDVSCNSNLQSLSSLSGAPLLHKVHAADCNIQDFCVLETCPNISKVYRAAADSSSDDEMKAFMGRLF